MRLRARGKPPLHTDNDSAERQQRKRGAAQRLFEMREGAARAEAGAAPVELGGLRGSAGGHAHEVGIQLDAELGATRAAEFVLVAAPVVAADRLLDTGFHECK